MRNRLVRPAFSARVRAGFTMLLGASFTSFGVSAGSLLFFGPAAPAILVESLTILGVVSAFVAICSAEARAAS